MNQKKIYVSNLSYDTKENDLENHFNQFGSINDIKLITDRDTGRSRGFAFIEFESQAAAEKAIKEGNNSLLMSRNVRVSVAREKKDRY
jgi:cold-inducible RNA-binding protein